MTFILYLIVTCSIYYLVNCEIDKDNTTSTNFTK